MSGKISITYSANWNRLQKTALEKLRPPQELYYSWLYLCSSRQRAAFLKKRFIEEKKLNGHISPPIATWNQFLWRLYGYLPLSQKLLNSAGQNLIIQQIMANLSSSLHFFSSKRRPVSTEVVSQITSFIQLWQFLHLTGKTAPARESELIEELNQIARAYVKIKNNRFIDECDLVKQFVNKTTNSEIEAWFPLCNQIFWEVDTPLSVSQLKIIDRFKKCGWNIDLFIHYDDHPDFFKNMDSFFENVRELADEEVCLTDTGLLTNSFYRLSEQVPRLELQISILKYNDRLHEAEDTAKQIKMDLIEDNIQAEHIAISAPDLSQYLPLLVNALKKYEIPFTISKPYPLTELLPVEHLQLIPDFIHENGDLGILKKILKSPFYHYHISLAAVPVDELLNSLRISYDLPAMISQLVKAITFDEKDTTADEDREMRIWQKKTLLAILKQIRKDCQCFDTAFTADDYFKFFTGLFEKQEVVKRIMEWQRILPQHDIADLLGALRAFVDALDNWRYLMNSLTPTPRFGKTHLLEIFRFIISNGHYQPLLLSERGIHITTLEALDSFEIEKLYMLGMSDANFPRKGGNLFSGLPEPYIENFRESRSYRDKQRFLKILSQTKREIVFSYPIFEDDSPQVGSALLLELNRVARIAIRNAPSLPIYSAGEILETLGPDIQSPSATYINSLSVPVDEDTLNTLRHQLNIQFQRDSHGDSGLYDGNLTGTESIPAYLEHYFQHSGYSISALETYAACPMLFYFQRVLGIGEPEEFEDWVTPREKGSLIHQVLFRFYSENSEEERTTEKLIEIATETLRELPFLPSVLWDIYSESFLGNQHAGQTGLFPAFLIYEEEQQADSPLRPVYFELPFGRIGRKISHNLPERFREPFVMEKNGFVLKLKGIVDRVEIGKQGGILIVDYKTGGYPNWREIIEGTSLQLPIYLEAIFTLLNRNGQNYYPLGAGYFQIKDENNIKKEIIFSQAKFPEENIKAKKQLPVTEITAETGDELTIDSLLQKSIDFAMGYAAGIQRGDFTHTTDSRRCAPGYQRRCPFEAICRINPAKSAGI